MKIYVHEQQQGQPSAPAQRLNFHLAFHTDCCYLLKSYLPLDTDLDHKSVLGTVTSYVVLNTGKPVPKPSKKELTLLLTRHLLYNGLKRLQEIRSYCTPEIG